MTVSVQSFVGGRFVRGHGARTPLVNPANETVLGELEAGGVDFAAAVAHARGVGGPALRELTFAQRAELLAAMAKTLHAHRDELLDLSVASGGNTRGDAKFDVDGGIGTLSYYAGVGKALGDVRVLADGATEQLGRTPRFVGRHFKTPLTGVAVHINAFNFPAWGFAEKAAVALLAGVPVLTKPAASTSLLAFRVMALLVEARLLPDGALSFIAGGVGDLFDHLTGQDVLAFTGSSDTAARLRAHPNLIRRAVRINVEADSLNATVVGPDVEASGDTFDTFMRDVVREITQKAGQKCTATRRIFVPSGVAARVGEALSEELKALKVGDPALKEVDIGPLATAEQRDSVRAGIERLKKAARSILGDGGRGKLVGVVGDQGFFVAPALFFADDAERASSVHEHEVFGPVATVMPYDGTAATAAKLVGLGAGGLVASAYTDDAAFAAAFTLGVAAHCGRVHLGGARVSEHPLGPGAVPPQLNHGGPGRAGGGAELGGLHGLDFYLQRTAVQGYAPWVEKLC